MQGGTNGNPCPNLLNCMDIIEKKYKQVNDLIEKHVDKYCICKYCEYSFMFMGKRNCQEPEPIMVEFVYDNDSCENHTFSKKYINKENRLEKLQDIWHKLYCKIYD